MIPFSYNIRSLLVRKTTTAATALGVALVVFVFAGVLMLRRGLDEILSDAGDPLVALVVRKGADNEAKSYVAQAQSQIVLKAQGVAMSGGRAVALGEVVSLITLERVGSDTISNVQLRGVAEDVFTFRPEVQIVAGRKPRPGTNEAIVGTAIRGRLRGLDIGGSFEIKRDQRLKVVGVFSATGTSYESEAWATVGELQRVFGYGDGFSSLRVKLTGPQAFDGFRAFIGRDPRLGLDVQRETDYYRAQSAGLGSLIRGLGVVVGIFFSLGAMLGAMITMYTSVANREKEIATLRALGFPRKSVLKAFLFESTLLTLVGGALGAAAAISLELIRIPMLNRASWSEIVLKFEATPLILTEALLLAAVVGLCGGLVPALRAFRVSPALAMRD